MPVPYTFANQIGNIALSELDANFANVKAAVDTAATVTASAQPAITSVGQLTSLGVLGNISSLIGGVYAPGFYYPNGVSILTGISSGSSSYGNSNVAAYLTVYNGSIDNLAGNVTTSASVNASAGVFTGSVRGGSVFGSILTTTGYVSATGAITGGSLVSNTTISGASVTATGDITAANFNTSGNLIATQRVQASAFLTAGAIQGSDIYSTGLLRGANLIVSEAANFTGLVTLNGNGSNAVIHTGNILPADNNLYDLGSSTRYYRRVYGTATQAQYADLAENYQADQDYPVGTVLMIGGAAEVTAASPGSKAVAGIVSENPAYLMNAELSGTNVVALALQGRVPCRVIGPVTKGDLLISAGDGYACADNQAQAGQIIGKALEDFSGEKGQIEAIVGRA